MKNKSWLSTIILCAFLILFITYRDDIANSLMQKIAQFEPVESPKINDFYNEVSFEFVKKIDDFHVKNYQNILDAIYTILDSGVDEFVFYCDESYNDCLNDFENISKDQSLLSTINNMVSPYNSYKKISFKYTSYGKITVNIEKLYTDEEIILIENKINEFINNNITNDMEVSEKIKLFHDYVINNSVYDKQRADAIESGSDNSLSNSHKANGPLIDGVSLCSGYSDAMKIYLDKFKISNYKVSNTNHIWNALYINDTWLHIDLTWDDPVTNTGENILLHKFFLIDTPTLFNLDSSGHNYNFDYYPEISR